MDGVSLLADGVYDPIVFPLRANLSKAVADAGYEIRLCEDESTLLQAAGTVPSGRSLADALQVARSALSEGDPAVFLVAHAHASRTRWVRLRDVLASGWRPSGGTIQDQRLSLELLLYAEQRGLSPSQYQVVVDRSDELAALENPRWGSARDSLHRIYALRRRLGQSGLWLQRQIPRQGEKVDITHEWQIALRKTDLLPPQNHLREAPFFLPLHLNQNDLPENPNWYFVQRFMAAIRRELRLAPILGSSRSYQGADEKPRLDELATLVRQYVQISAFFGCFVHDEAWETIPMEAVEIPPALMADRVRLQRREFLAAVAHYLGPRAGIAQKRAWKTTLTAIERFQEFVYEESDAQGDAKGLRERVTTMATRSGVAPSTARLMILKKAPESFERLEYLLNAYGKTLEIRDIEKDEQPL